MSKAAKIWLVTAAALVILGFVVMTLAGCAVEWDFSKLSTVKYETNTHEFNENFDDISIKTDTSDVVFLTSEDGKCRVVCHEQENLKHSVSLEDGVLTVKVEDTREWYEHINIGFLSTKISVYLPKTEYSKLNIEGKTGDVDIPDGFGFESIGVSLSTGDVECSASASGEVKIKTSTGDVSLKDTSVGSLDVSVSTGDVSLAGVDSKGDVKIYVSTGDVSLSSVACTSFISDGSTGEIYLKNVIASGKFNIQRSTGDVNFDRCDAAEIFVETSTGDVRGSLLSEKVFFANTDTGRKDVPNTASGGRCEISSDTGDVIITIAN